MSDKILPCVKQYIILRKMKEMTQSDVSEKTGVPMTSIAKIESGNRQPSLQMMSKLAFAVGGQVSVIPLGK